MMLSQLVKLCRHRMTSTTIRHTNVVYRRMYQTQGRGWKDRLRKRFAQFERQMDKTKPSEQLIYRSESAYFVVIGRLVLLPITLFGAYYSFTQIVQKDPDSEFIHPSQRLHTNSVPPFLGWVGVVLSLTLFVMTIAVSKVFVQRVYYDRPAQTFRLVISTVAGFNRHLSLKPGGIIANNSSFTHRTRNGQKLFVAPETFVDYSYYELLLGKSTPN